MIKLFYPSSFLPHKNHDALLSEGINKCLIDLNIKLFLTIESAFLRHFSNIVYLGRISKAECTSHLLTSTALLWVSSTESFGLPLFEAVKLNKPIIAIDKPYILSLFKESIYTVCTLSDHEIIKAFSRFASDYNDDCLVEPILHHSFKKPCFFVEKFHNVLY